ncbi:AMP-binding protein [Nocardia sp. NPDC052278]|uniref:AMP-binding protein n=1 Tax=unclassified Nocardia TaxID=2637762 RepID=UPI0036C8C09F
MPIANSLTLGDVSREHRRSRPGFPAVVDVDVRLTYREFDIRVNQLVSALTEQGLTPGDVIVWFGQNSFRLLELLVAAAKAGWIVVPVNWRESATRLTAVVEQCAPRVVVWQETEIGALASEVRSATAPDIRWVCHDREGADSYETLLASGTDVDDGAVRDMSEHVLAIYTAGSDDNGPAAALIDHLAILVENLTIARISELSDSTVFLNSGPLFHLGTLVSTLATFHLGGKNVFVRRVDPAELCRVIDMERCNRAFLMAPTVAEIREIASRTAVDLSCLWPRSAQGEWSTITPSLNPTTHRSGSYGQTEVMGLATFGGLGEVAISPFGRPLPTVQIVVLRPDGTEADIGETGELAFRGPTVSRRFLGRDELIERREFDGWLMSGDLGLRESDGSIRFVAPKGRLIKSASENIHPAEVERCLAAHPAIADVCVIGVPDRDWGQSVKALVVVEPGETVDADEVIGFCRRNLASYKKPRFVQFVDAIPRTGPGQIDRAAADALGGGGGYPGEISGSARRLAPAGRSESRG